jgi:hypothetical protein
VANQLQMKKFLAQEKDYLLTTMEVEEFENLEKLKLKSFTTFQQDLWVNLLKNGNEKLMILKILFTTKN